jgi:hypothetical protein
MLIRHANEDEYIPSKRRKLSPDSYIGIHDTPFVVKTEALDDDLYRNSFSVSPDSKSFATYLGLHYTDPYPSVSMASWETDSVQTATPSLISCSTTNASSTSLASWQDCGQGTSDQPLRSILNSSWTK